MKKVFKTILIVFLIGLFVGTLFFLYKKSQKKPVIYDTKKPFVTDIIRKTVATGSVVPRNEIEIKPQQVSGIIQELYIEPGEMVKEGDLIAKVKIIPNMVQLNDARTRVNKARINYEDAKLVYDRQHKIFKQGVIPLAEFQKYEMALQQAKEDLKAAENHLQLIKEGVSKESDNTSNTLIRSTINGMVLDVPVEIGNSVIETNTFNPGTTIAFVADMTDMIFEGKVDETEVGKIRTGMNIELTIGAIDKEKFDAVLEYIAPKGVEENGAIQFEIKAKVRLKETQFIRAGYSATADIVLEKKDSVMAIPESLLNWDEKDSAYVEVKTGEEGQWEKKYVDLGISDGINIEVLSGLSGEDEIKAMEKKEGKEKV